MTPRVSISIPVYNGAATIRATLESALEQTFTDTEILVVDNASTDGTPDIVASYDDPRIRLHVNPANLGFVRNHSLSLELTRGEYVKPLHADDRLLAGCVERMVEALDAHPGMGMVFAPRIIELEDEEDPVLRRWREDYARSHERFEGLEAVNDGPFLLAQMLRENVAFNWVGEPTSLLYRRSALERVGSYSQIVKAYNDIEMIVRLLALFPIGFIDEPLSVYRRAHGSVQQTLVRRDWLDRLWLLEGLVADGEMRARNPEAEAALRRERAKVARVLVRTARRRPDRLPERLADLRRYAGYRARLATGARPRLHPPLRPVAA